jgi:hypothetical protein
MWTKNFWQQTGERAVKTLAQSALAVLAVDGLGVLDVDWAAVGSVAALASVVSVLTSIATAGIGEPNDPSAIRRPLPTTEPSTVTTIRRHDAQGGNW